MESKYIYLIVGLVLLVGLTLVAILRNPKGKVSFKAPGFLFRVDGSTNSEQEKQESQGNLPSAKLKIGGNVKRSKLANIAREGNAETDVGKDVEETDIRNEN
jgi:hypothetical protein